MAADEGNIIGQCHKLGLDGGDQLIVIAKGQIGAANRTTEQDVAHDGEAALDFGVFRLTAPQEYDGPGSVSYTHLDVYKRQRRRSAPGRGR